MIQVGRSWKRKDYRFSFNGKEDESWGVQDYGFRFYDERIARFLSVDPLTAKYPELTPYQFASNIPIKFIDLDGAEGGYFDPMTGVWILPSDQNLHEPAPGVYPVTIEAYRPVLAPPRSEWKDILLGKRTILKAISKEDAITMGFMNKDGTIPWKLDTDNSYLERLISGSVYNPLVDSKIGDYKVPIIVDHMGKAEGYDFEYNAPKGGNIPLIGGVGKVGTKTILKQLKLPTTGKIRFVPPKEWKPSNGVKGLKSGSDGYVDKFGNIWKKGPSRTSGEAFEWDVQIKNQEGWLAKFLKSNKKDSNHANVSLKGRLTH